MVGEETVVLPAYVLLDNHLGIGCAGFPQGDLGTIEVNALVDASTNRESQPVKARRLTVVGQFDSGRV